MAQQSDPDHQLLPAAEHAVIWPLAKAMVNADLRGEEAVEPTFLDEPDRRVPVLYRLRIREWYEGDRLFIDFDLNELLQFDLGKKIVAFAAHKKTSFFVVWAILVPLNFDFAVASTHVDEFKAYQQANANEVARVPEVVFVSL